jgi:hypothetical protein
MVRPFVPVIVLILIVVTVKVLALKVPDGLVNPLLFHCLLSYLHRTTIFYHKYFIFFFIYRLLGQHEDKIQPQTCPIDPRGKLLTRR